MSKSVTKTCSLPHKVTVSSLLTTGIVGSETCSLTLKNDSIMRSTFSILYYINRSKVKTDGRRFIRINRKKTDVESFIPLHPVAEQILSLYNTTDDGRPVFPLPNRNRLWYCIHEIGILAGVKENLSYHASRHSFGTLTLSAGVPIESISKMMGHTNIRTTQGYAKVTDDKISEDMDRLMERWNAMGDNSPAKK